MVEEQTVNIRDRAFEVLRRLDTIMEELGGEGPIPRQELLKQFATSFQEARQVLDQAHVSINWKGEEERIQVAEWLEKHRKNLLRFTHQQPEKVLVAVA